MNQDAFEFYKPVLKNPLIRDLPETSRPQYRLQYNGPDALSNIELLATVIGSNDGLNQAAIMLAKFNGLAGIAKCSEKQLQAIPGIGPSTAIKIRASLELGGRIDRRPADGITVRSPDDIAKLLMAKIGSAEQEQFVVIPLNTRNRVLHIEILYVGTLNSTHLRLSEVFEVGLKYHAAALILAHNHPSGDVHPSPEDINITRNAISAGEMLDMEVMDHIVVGSNKYLSMRERGMGFN